MVFITKLWSYPLSTIEPTSDPIVAAIRPENIAVQLLTDSPADVNIAIPGTIDQISFIGREMEVHATTENGETLKVISRPDAQILEQNAGAKVQFVFARNDVSLFSDGPNGQILT